jgi:hypothetical protein
MNLTVPRFLIALAINLLASVPLSAVTLEQKDLSFPVRSRELLTGEIHYFLKMLSPATVTVQYPDLAELDSLGLLKRRDVAVIVSKAVYVVKKPVGFFDDKQLVDEKYVAHTLGDQRVKRLAPESFQVTVPGDGGYSYKLRAFFDADDVSTLPSSKVTRAVTAAKQLDVISKGSSLIMLRELTAFTGGPEAGVAVSSFIPLREDRTLVITYNLWAVKREALNGKAIREEYIEEVEAIRKLQESFR